MYNVHANDADMKFFMKFLSDGNSFQENTKMLISQVSYSLELDSVFFLRTFFDTSSVQDEDWLLSSSLTLFLLITKLLGSEILIEICHLRSWMIYILTTHLIRFIKICLACIYDAKCCFVSHYKDF